MYSTLQLDLTVELLPSFRKGEICVCTCVLVSRNVWLAAYKNYNQNSRKINNKDSTSSKQAFVF